MASITFLTCIEYIIGFVNSCSSSSSSSTSSSSTTTIILLLLDVNWLQLIVRVLKCLMMNMYEYTMKLLLDDFIITKRHTFCIWGVGCYDKITSPSKSIHGLDNNTCEWWKYGIEVHSFMYCNADRLTYRRFNLRINRHEECFNAYLHKKENSPLASWMPLFAKLT